MDWISVEDRLPESGEEVLIAYHLLHDKNSQDIFIGYIYIPEEGDQVRQMWHIAPDDISMDGFGVVTHWMSLPELPGGK